MRSMCWSLATYPIQARCRVPSLVRAECMKWHRDNPCLFRMWLKGLLPSSRRRLASPRADKACEAVLNGQARWQQNRLPSKKSRTIKLESAAVGPMFEHREEDFILRSRQHFASNAIAPDLGTRISVQLVTIYLCFCPPRPENVQCLRKYDDPPIRIYLTC